MADNEVKETIEFKFTPKGGEDQTTVEGFTGEGTATYTNGDIYRGEFVEGVF
jgi:hypothetical protein